MSPQEQKRKSRLAAEVTVLAVAAAIVLFMIGYSVYHGLTVGRVPHVTAHPQFAQVYRQGDSYVLPITVRNTAQPTAADVVVEVEVRTPDGTLETKQFDIPYLPEHGSLTGYIVLAQSPTPDTVRAEVVSFKTP